MQFVVETADDGGFADAGGACYGYVGECAASVRFECCGGGGGGVGLGVVMGWGWW